MSSGVKQRLKNGRIMIIIFTPNFPSQSLLIFQRQRGLSKIILPHVSFEMIDRRNLFPPTVSYKKNKKKSWMMHNSVGSS